MRFDTRKKTVGVQLVSKVTVSTPLSLSRFPFDAHVVPFVVAERAWKEGGVSHRWRLERAYPDWAFKKFKNGQERPEYAEDQHCVNQKIVSFKKSALEFLPPFPYFPIIQGNEGKPMLCVRLQRNPDESIINITLPVFVVVLIGLCVFLLQPDNTDMQYNSGLASLLTMTAYMFATSEKLPQDLPYLTLAHWYVQARVQPHKGHASTRLPYVSSRVTSGILCSGSCSMHWKV